MEYVAIILILVSSIVVFYRTTKRKRNYIADEVHYENNSDKRKQKFLQSEHGQTYGYRNSEKGYIDKWRATEYPHLIPPLGEKRRKDDAEIYLDSAGSALPSLSLLDAIHSYNINTVLGNPHSTGPAAARSKAQIEITKTRLLKFFGAHTGSLFGCIDASSSGYKEKNSKDFHPGYEIVFTSGSTDALRIVAENFQWNERKSVLVYSKNSHTSVIGMREAALRDGAIFRCEEISKIINANIHQFDSWASVGRIKSINHDYIEECIDDTNQLLVLPLECNFGGIRYNVKNPICTSRKAQGNWMTMLDISKAVSTSPIDLCELDPDFACVSFYKCFGAPTGIGALFVKRSSMQYLTSKSRPRYFGGGSIDVVSPIKAFTRRRGDEESIASLTHGTPNFRGIPTLSLGLDELKSLGGMSEVSNHTRSLATEAFIRLENLKHFNGEPVILIYNQPESVDLEKLHVSSIITFNIRYPDGSFVGYNTVCKLAENYRVPIQLRSGCFCNPGACQDALGLTDSDVEDNYIKHGHVCGDHIDIVDNRPTGCLRISIGKETIFEDIDSFIEFIEETFVSRIISDVDDYSLCQNGSENVSLEKIFIFPIKSCGAYEVSAWPFDHQVNKLQHDRDYALVDNSGTAIRLNQYPKMSLISPKIDLEQNNLTVSAPGRKDLIISLDYGASTSRCIQVCRNKCFGNVYGGDGVSDWFSSYLEIRCWLVKWDASKNASAYKEDLGTSIPRVGFANEAPILLLSLASIQKLNSILGRDNNLSVDARHFRPNLVVSTKRIRSNNPEDSWKSIHFPSQKFSLKITGRCQRCSMIDIDPSSGMKGKTLRALAEYRKSGGGGNLTFGVFAQRDLDVGNSTGLVERIGNRTWIHIGDPIIAK